MDGLYFKQGLNTGLLSLCVEGDRENAIPQTQVHSLTCSAFLNVKEKELKLPMALKKMENIIFWGYFHSKENIVKYPAIYKFVFVQG